jgi:hypothetical protein
MNERRKVLEKCISVTAYFDERPKSITNNTGWEQLKYFISPAEETIGEKYELRM